MSRYKIRDPHGLNFLTLTVVDWVDVFIRKQYKDIIIESLRFCQQQKGLQIGGYTIMSSHVHLIAQAAGTQTLSEVLRDFKKFTAKKILQEIETGGYESRREWMLHRFAYRGREQADRTFQLWVSDNHPIELFTFPVVMQKLQYIHENAVQEGLVLEAADYPYCSASNYFRGEGILDVDLIELPNSLVGYLPLKM